MQMGRTTSSLPITWPPRADGVCQDALPVLDESGSDADALSEGERGTLLPTALAWLRADRELRIKTERESGNVKRGAKAGQVDTDSETVSPAKAGSAHPLLLTRGPAVLQEVRLQQLEKAEHKHRSGCLANAASRAHAGAR